MTPAQASGCPSLQCGVGGDLAALQARSAAWQNGFHHNINCYLSRVGTDQYCEPFTLTTFAKCPLRLWLKVPRLP